MTKKLLKEELTMYRFKSMLRNIMDDTKIEKVNAIFTRAAKKGCHSKSLTSMPRIEDKELLDFHDCEKRFKQGIKSYQEYYKVKFISADFKVINGTPFATIYIYTLPRNKITLPKGYKNYLKVKR
jgi:hypothetical protein